MYVSRPDVESSLKAQRVIVVVLSERCLVVDKTVYLYEP